MSVVLSSGECLKHLGVPSKAREGLFMTLRTVDADIAQAFPCLPRAIYCSRYIPAKLAAALRDVMQLGYAEDIRTWDGCFNVRSKKGGGHSFSLHSWGLAVDLNAAWNQFGQTPSMPQQIVTAFERNGFDWGGRWSTPDGMHFQLSREAFLSQMV